jgi:hypothetical protein
VFAIIQGFPRRRGDALIREQNCTIALRSSNTRWHEPVGRNRCSEKAHALFPCSAARSCQAHPYPSFILYVALTRQVARTFHTLEQRSDWGAKATIYLPGGLALSDE